MDDAACADREDLPWTAEPEQVTAWEQLIMGAVCQDCPVLGACQEFAQRAFVTAGFWAGRLRKPDADRTLPAGPAWASDPLPTFDPLGGVA